MRQLSGRPRFVRWGPGPIAIAGVYVHFPWCLAKCPYCDFVSYARERTAIDHAAYADAVLRELDARAPSVEGRRIDTIFFGGGTPSLWEPQQLGRVVRGIRERLGCAGEGELEVTVECNPTSLDAERARALVDQGVNRVSLGVQSLRDDRGDGGERNEGAGEGVRYRNEVLPERYVASAPPTREPLDAATLMRERIMLGLRVDAGVDLDEAAAALGTPGWTAERTRTAEKLVERGRVVREGGRLRVPRAAWLWTDDTAARLF